MPLLLLGLALGGGYLWYRNRPIWGLAISTQNPNQAYVTDLNAGMDADRNQKIPVHTYTINPDGSAYVVDDNGTTTISAKNIVHF